MIPVLEWIGVGLLVLCTIPAAFLGHHIGYALAKRWDRG